MTPDELRRALDELDLTQREAAEALGVSLRTVEKWACGVHPIPGPAARLVRLWVRRSDLRPAAEGEHLTEEVLR